MKKRLLSVFVIFIMTAGLFLINLVELESSPDENKNRYDTKKLASPSDESIEIIDSQVNEDRKTESMESKIATICETLRSMDFTVNEPHMDITPEENSEYLEAYLQVLKNEMPVYDQMGEETYYRDLWKVGTEFEILLEEKGERENHIIW